MAIKRQIEQEEPPFDDPPYSEDPEPAFLEEWLEAETSIQIVGLACVSLLADTLKLYLTNRQSAKYLIQIGPMRRSTSR